MLNLKVALISKINSWLLANEISIDLLLPSGRLLVKARKGFFSLPPKFITL